MDYISNKRFQILRWAVILYCTHFLAVYFYLVYRNHSWHGNHIYGIVLAAIVGVQIIYEIVATIIFTEESILTATFITTTFALAESFFLINSTGVYRSPYLIPIVILIFLSGLLERYWLVSVILTLIMTYVAALPSFFNYNANSIVHGIIFVIGITTAVIISYRVWRHLNTPDNTTQKRNNPEFNALNKMLKARQEQSALILQSIDDGAIVFDATGKINFFNPTIAALTEWQVSEAIGIDINIVVKLSPIDNKPQLTDTAIFNNVLLNGKTIKTNMQLTGRNNRLSIVSLVVSPIIVPPDNAILGAVAIFRDITEQHKEEQQRADFVSTASHEMRTPVAAIEGYLSLALNNKICAIDNKARDYLVKAYDATKHLGKLFQDLLTSTRAEDGRLTSNPTVVEIGGFLNQLVQDLHFIAQAKNLGIDLVIGTDESQAINPQVSTFATKVIRPLYYVYADPDRLREVITNLFDNAVKYTKEGKISIGLTGNTSVVQFFVKDTGMGIPEEDVPHLFQKFYRVDNSATRKVGGTGLGLFISQKIIELYHGRMWVESTLGKGSTFYIDLPRLSPDKATKLMAKLATPPQQK